MVESQNSGCANVHGHVPRDLLHPLLIGENGDPGDQYPAALEVDEEQHVVGHPPAQRQHFGSEEVGARQQIQVRTNEVGSCGRALSLRHR